MVGNAHADTVAIERSVLLWCMRALLAEGSARAEVHRVLAGLGAPDATASMIAFVDAIAAGGGAGLTVHPLNWRGISRDEHVLLDVLSLEQQSRSIEALLLLRGLLSPAAARMAADSAAMIGATLARSGWLLDPPNDRNVSHYAMSA